MAALAGTGLAAQERMVFEVASVKPNTSGPAAGQSLNGQGDTLVVTNMTVRDLITRAYQVQGGANAALAANSPSLFTALQEQLGLTLEPARAPVDVLVIGRLERPTPD